VKKEWLESAVVRHVATALADVKTRKEIALKLLEAQKEIAHSISPAERSINARIQQTKTKIANINNAIAGGIWNSTTSATLTQLENELTRLYKQLSEADRAKVSINNSYEDIISVLNEISATTVFDEESQKVMAHFIERVTVYDDKISIVLNPLKTEVTEITDIDGAGDRNQSINVSSLLLLFDFICNNR
jgi:predicted  nucleic acid-binding Zn-ribbon protein